MTEPPDRPRHPPGLLATRAGGHPRQCHDRRRMRPGHAVSPLGRVLFPATPRRFPGERWINNWLRSAHLVGVAGIGGGYLFGLAEAQWLPFWHLTLGTGVALSLLYLWASVAWLLQLKGLAIVVKLALLALAVLLPPWRGELFILVIVISGLIAHAPGAVRGYRLV